MTSSLVGSEMCIRDSYLPTYLPTYLSTSLPSCLPASPPTRRCCKAVPVSYTHLTLPTICSV
eukprot:8445328-Prorocentrum_lima.AAC.1